MALLTEREPLSPDGQRYFRYVHDAADRMGALIDAVYYYTRLDGSAPQIVKETCDLGSLLEQTKVDLTELIREKDAQITADPLPQLQANALQIRQVLQNLISNAIRHCESDPAVHISARDDGDAWTISVSDNGRGVDEALRERVFEPFTRFAVHKNDGLGMGLAICKRIMESHGGAIRCETAPSGGASFILTLPKGAAVASVAQPARAAPAQTDGPATEQKPLARILVIDDNEAAIELTRIVLMESGKLRCVLVSARGGREALTLLQQSQSENATVDLVLLDISMPEMDGFQFLEKLRADESMRAIPVVMCTTSSHDKDMERAREMGAAGYITKPAELSKLRSLIHNVPTLRLSEQANGRLLLRVA